MTLTTLRLSKSGQTLSLRDQGAGDAVVLIHGVGMQSAAWMPQIEHLSKSRRVIAIDLPGHGGTDRLAKGARIPDFVAWFHDVVGSLGVGPVAVVGHSMGALIAAGFAAEHPELTQRVALLNGVYRRTRAAKNAVIARALEIAKGRVDLEAPLSRWFGSSPTDQSARTQVAGWLSVVDHQGYATAYEAFAHGDAVYANKLPKIDCPFLALTGDGDPNSTPEMSETMASKVQNGRAVIVRGHRHMVNLTAPQAVSRHLDAWLDAPAAAKVTL